MTPDIVLDVGQRALEITAALTGVILIPALVVGLVVAMFQAATQINEMTLTFIPKLMIVALVLMVAGPWMLQLIMDFVVDLFESIPELIG
jgi:flagellar biosynthetic protein FliQ